MELESTPQTVEINGEIFDVVKPVRLLPGMVLKSRTRNVYARVGPKQSALEEQIHTVSLYERGFPVAGVLESGTYSDDEWYFVEESLGDKTFHVQFSEEYKATGAVSNETFTRYLHVLEAYTTAQYNPANRTDVSAKEFIETAVPDSDVLANYQICGGDIERYHEAMSKATEKISGSPMGVLQFDLNPSNVLENGVIDFELVGYGPLGYDSSLTSLWHRWFTRQQTRRFKIAYELTNEQIDIAQKIVSDKAQLAGIANPQEYMQEFLLIKTAWGFTSQKPIHDEPESKQAFYHYRATLLSTAVEAYLASEPIQVLNFPDVRALPGEASAIHPIPPTQ